jgi:hypothetical protein
MSNLANIALDGGDPRLGVNGEEKYDNEKIMNNSEGNHTGARIKPQSRPLHDSSITFAEYLYYAKKTRAEEEEHVGEIQKTRGWVEMIFPSKSGMGAGNVKAMDEHGDAHVNLSDRKQRASVSDEEWTNASRALRTATKSAIFYLITTDILGPFGLPFAFATTGWG